MGASSGLSIELLAGLVYSAQALTMMIASPIWGALADRYGRKLMVERAMFGGAAILFLMAFVQNAEQLVLLRVIQGLITGTMSAANALAASTVPRQRIGFAMGMLQVGMGAGVAFGPMIGGVMADTFGYASSFYITALLLLISGVLVWWGIQEDFQPAPPAQGKKPSMLAGWRNVLRTPGVPPTFSLRFMSQLGRMMIIPIAPLFIQTLLVDPGRTNTITGLVIGVASATTTISAIYLGKLGDRTGHRRVIILSALAAAALYGIQTFVANAWQLLVLQAFVGVAMGGIIPGISALLANYSHSNEVGAVYGLDNSIDAAGRSIAPLLGSVIAVSLSLRATFAASGLIFLVTGLLALWSLPALLPKNAAPGEARLADTADNS